MKKFAVLTFLSALLIAVFAIAGGKYDGHFGDIDKNSDKVVVKDEFVEFFKANGDPAAAFVIIDVDKSGGIDHDEWHAFKEAHGYGHKDSNNPDEKK